MASSVKVAHESPARQACCQNMRSHLQTLLQDLFVARTISIVLQMFDGDVVRFAISIR